MNVQRQLFIALSVRASSGLLAGTLTLWAVAHAKATVVTLRELIKESQVIVYGHTTIGPQSAGAQRARIVPFAASLVLKGESLVGTSTILLCNPQVNLDRPDLSMMTGNNLLFLSQNGVYFDLSHSYRSVVEVRDGQAFADIKDQPEYQAFDLLLQKIRLLVANVR